MSENNSLVTPSTILPGKLLLSSANAAWRGLTFERHRQQPAEIETPPLSEHLIFTLFNSVPATNKSPNQIFRFNGKESKGAAKLDEMFFLPAETPAFCRWTAMEDKAALIIEPHFVRQVALETFEMNPDRVEVIGSVWIRDEIVPKIARILSAELEQPAGIGGKLFAESMITALAIHLLRNYCAFAPSVKNYSGGLAPIRLRRVLDFIQANLEGEFSLRELAAVAEISEFHFARQFKRSTGFAPYQFVLKTRIVEAQRLLRQTNLSVMEIALLIGFSSQSKLAVHFRRQLGVAPNEYRQTFK